MDSNRTFSEKITILSFSAAVGIVYLHTPWNASATYWGSAIQHCFLQLLHCCVPLFFFISGYLYFRNYTVKDWKRKTLTRLKTLLIPYILWCIIYGTIMYILTYTGVAHTDILTDSKIDVILSILNADYCHLWYIRYLIIFSLISPILYYSLANKLLGGGIIIICVIQTFINIKTDQVSSPPNVNENSLSMLIYQCVYYIAGGFSSIHLKKWFELSTYNQRIIWGTALLTALMLIYNSNLLHGHLFRLLAIPCIWMLADITSKIQIKYWMKFSFFIYLSHLIIVLGLSKFSSALIKNYEHQLSYFTNDMHSLSYILIPPITIAIICILAIFLKKYNSKTWNILVGGRG